MWILFSFFLGAVVSTDEIPLNSVNSTNSENQRESFEQQQSAADEAERRLLDVRQAPTVDCSRLRVAPQQKSPFQRPHSDETESLLNSQRGIVHSANDLRDINAMSIASIYDREHNEVDDADK